MPKINRGARSCQDQDKAIGERINMYRRAKELSQANLGAALGITFQQVQKYEKGVNRVSASRLVLISELLEVSIADLLGGSSQETTSDMADVMACMVQHNGVRLARLIVQLTSSQQTTLGSFIKEMLVEKAV
jgi:transcriptional regulator with XRE-family HTH domain